MTKSFLIAYLGNPLYDTRIKNLIHSFSNLNYEVSVIGFEWEMREIQNSGSIKIHNLDRTPSVNFYLKYLLHLFKFLLNHKTDYYFAEDVYTLVFVAIFAKLRRKKLFYNSRELYPHLAGLRKRKFIQFGLAFIEKLFIKIPDFVMTTGEMDAEFLRSYYKINKIITLRNLPKLELNIRKIDLHQLLSIPEDSFIMLYQGVIIDGRGIQAGIKLLQSFENLHFVILGDGEKKSDFQKQANLMGISNRAHFVGSINQESLISYTASADLGLALIENLSMSYYYALPGKLFEYIMAEIPVLCSDLPQMKKIIRHYKVGRYVDVDNVDDIIKNLNDLLLNPELLKVFRHNCSIAKKELSWEKEFSKLKEIL